MRYMKPFINYLIVKTDLNHNTAGLLRLAPLLALCFPGSMIHGIFCYSQLLKAWKVSFLENYRLIALSRILSKILKRILPDRVSVHISSLDNQFGLKRKHGANMYICT